MIKGLFDVHSRLAELDASGDPLVRLNQLVSWEVLRPTLERVHEKERKSNAGARPYDVIMMFKLLVLQSLYNLADNALEYQVLDRLSFMRFLGLGLGDKVPDGTTLWRFRDGLGKLGLVEELFAEFDGFLRDHGFEARKGQIIDASIVAVRKQRNHKEENEKIKAGERVEEWSEAKRCQKDVDARWTRKNYQNHFGYKNHVSVDVEHKLIRTYKVTHAAVHDSQVFGELLDEANRDRGVWADSAYGSKENCDLLATRKFEENLQRKGVKDRKLTPAERERNHRLSPTRCRVEHIFGFQAQRAGNLLIRTVGMVRARCKIGLRNLAYNLERYALLVATSG